MSTVRIKKGRKETDYTNVSTIQKTYYDDGVDVVLRNDDGKVIRKVEMPRDAKEIYIMNGAGDTTDSIHWPQKKAQPAEAEDAAIPSLRV